MSRKRIVLLVLPPVEELDPIAPVEVFGTATRLMGSAQRGYELEIVTLAPDRRIDGECGLSLVAHRHYRELVGTPDSLVLICGLIARHTRDRALFEWLRRKAANVRRLGAVCVGAYVLAEAGLLDGKRATVHWKYAQEMAARYPRVTVDPRPIWVQAGKIYTSAGISEGIDLALAWVGQDFGAATALKVARELVLFLRRPGGQDQCSISLKAQAARTKPLHESRTWMIENLDQRLPVDRLARRVNMSPRTFARAFAREIGTFPARYLLQLRIEDARRLLEQTDKGLDEVAAASGFGSPETMRRGFLRALGTTPQRYRSYFCVRQNAAG